MSDSATIELASGAFFDLEHPETSEFTLADVAHGLSMTCRFSGQCSRFYSVAQHALLVADRLKQSGYGATEQLAGLHHDDAEAFLTDIPSPAKPLIRGYKDLESRVLTAILHHLGIGVPVKSKRVKEADMWALAQEAWYLMPSRGDSWLLDYRHDSNCVIKPLSSWEAAGLWMSRHNRLVTQL